MICIIEHNITWFGVFMDKDKLIIIALVVIIVVLLVGMFVPKYTTPKNDTQLTFISNSTINKDDSLKIKLTDSNGTALSNKTVNITIEGHDGSKSQYSVVTKGDGVGTLKLDEEAGEYNITITYNGDDRYNGCGASKSIIIEEETVEMEQVSSTSDESVQDSGAYYSPQAGKTLYTGEVVDSPGGKMRHLGNNEWEPV